MGWTAGRLFSSERGEAGVSTASMAKRKRLKGQKGLKRQKGEIFSQLAPPSVS